MPTLSPAPYARRLAPHPIVAQTQGGGVALAKSKGLGVAKHNYCEGANTMIMERGARPDTLPKPERGKAVLIGWLGVAVGLVLGLGLGIGLGAALWSIGALGATHTNHAGVGVLSACERFFQCSTSDADEIPGPEELETMSAQRQARYAEPKWGTP